MVEGVEQWQELCNQLRSQERERESATSCSLLSNALIGLRGELERAELRRFPKQYMQGWDDAETRSRCEARTHQ
eukprot:4080505-Amphidinium_carterae.2